uniref:Uncharacterized protein n=1 Tax=Meloidogyne enterolobii TaxID=390850 RepID=A0A6V7WZW6_MELEN|nr:unnamed protein product [Meloidogyne enterolobii]
MKIKWTHLTQLYWTSVDLDSQRRGLKLWELITRSLVPHSENDDF